ncbi:hypothetical protein QBC40DRAFT_296270 [Triangularia verruculosa]|uniref:Uncharacterized protein n=1 Tax=Triangularia verruculosa TaxID=2587418 RepID=A0AAN6XHI2_9PEZI|nr:hypothetical protein QBC40DRAFT_296270 [Triangularia verruculosa]
MKFTLAVAVTAIAGIVTALPVQEREVEALEALSVAGTATDATTTGSAQCGCTCLTLAIILALILGGSPCAACGPGTQATSAAYTGATGSAPCLSLANLLNIPILPIPPACAGVSCGACSGATGSPQCCADGTCQARIIPILAAPAVSCGACGPAPAAAGTGPATSGATADATTGSGPCCVCVVFDIKRPSYYCKEVNINSRKDIKREALIVKFFIKIVRLRAY